jgi:flagellin
VNQSAEKAELRFASPTTASSVTLDIQGRDGVITLTFPASASTVDMVAAINTNVDSTGVIATASGVNGSAGLRIQSLAYGSKAFVSVTALSGSFPLIDSTGVPNVRDEGQDALATVNGISATADGLKLSFSSTALKLDVILAEAFGNGSSGLGSSAFAITRGGALFQLGPQVNTNLQENIGVKAMQANKLGTSLVGYLSELKTGQPKALSTGRFAEASDVVDETITQVAVLRGRLGAFERNTLQTNIRQLQITAENLISSESVIRDTDFAAETSELTRSQILVQAGNSVLAIANAQSQNVLTLLGQ